MSQLLNKTLDLPDIGGPKEFSSHCKYLKYKAKCYYEPQIRLALLEKGIEAKQSELGKVHYDLYYGENKIEVKTFSRTNIKEYNTLCLELTNVASLGWYFQTEANILAISLQEDDIIKNIFYLDFLKLKKYVDSLMENYLGDSWFEQIQNHALKVIENSEIIIKCQKNTRGYKWLLFIKDIYNNDLTEIKHDKIKEFVLSEL